MTDQQPDGWRRSHVRLTWNRNAWHKRDETLYSEVGKVLTIQKGLGPVLRNGRNIVNDKYDDNLPSLVLVHLVPQYNEGSRDAGADVPEEVEGHTRAVVDVEWKVLELEAILIFKLVAEASVV